MKINGYTNLDSAMVMFIRFDTTMTDAIADDKKGLMFWNDTTKTIEIVNGDGSITSIAQEQNIWVKNVSGVDIFNGDIVYIIPSGSDEIRVGLADKDDALKAYTAIALATTDIPHGGYGRICSFGLTRNLNTFAYPEGTWLYLGDDGKYLTAAPDTGHIIVIGMVMRQHPNDGVIAVKQSQTSSQQYRVTDRYAENGIDISYSNGIRYFGTLKPPHAFLVFSDSTILLDLTQNNWMQITNSYDSLYRVIDNEYINISGDTIIAGKKGSYVAQAEFYVQGTATPTTWNVAPFVNSSMHYSSATRTTATNQTGAVSVTTYWEAEVGDKLYYMFRNKSNDTDLTVVGSNIIITNVYLSE